MKRHVPDDRRLDDVLAVLVDRLEHVCRLGLLLGLDRHVEVDTDLLRLEAYMTRQSLSEQPRET